jgi:hypothetical protein
MASSQNEEVWNYIEKFLTDTICGYYSGIYKMLGPVLTQEHIISVQLFNVIYFNDAYRSLIRRDDEYIMRVFDKLHSFYNHSYICLLNITFFHTNTILEKITIDKLNLKDYETFMNSVSNCIKNNIASTNLREKFITSFNHKCEGIDISKCNPNEDMFIANPHIVYKD